MRLALRRGQPCRVAGAARRPCADSPPPTPGAGWRCPGSSSPRSAPDITARLAAGHATAPELAADLGLDPLPTRLLLDCLRSAGHVTERSGRYGLSRSARRWLDPASPLSVAAYVAGAADYWPWWSRPGRSGPHRQDDRLRTMRGPLTLTGGATSPASGTGPAVGGRGREETPAARPPAHAARHRRRPRRVLRGAVQRHPDAARDRPRPARQRRGRPRADRRRRAWRTGSASVTATRPRRSSATATTRCSASTSCTTWRQTRPPPCSAGSAPPSTRVAPWPCSTSSPSQAAAAGAHADTLALFVYLSSGARVHTPHALGELAARRGLRPAEEDQNPPHPRPGPPGNDETGRPKT